MRALNQITKLQLLKYRARLSDIPIDIWQKIQKLADSSFALVIQMSKAGDSTKLVMHMPSCKHPLEDRDSGLSITNSILNKKSQRRRRIRKWQHLQGGPVGCKMELTVGDAWKSIHSRYIARCLLQRFSLYYRC